MCENRKDCNVDHVSIAATDRTQVWLNLHAYFKAGCRKTIITVTIRERILLRTSLSQIYDFGCAKSKACISEGCSTAVVAKERLKKNPWVLQPFQCFNSMHMTVESSHIMSIHRRPCISVGSSPNFTSQFISRSVDVDYGFVASRHIEFFSSRAY